MHGLPDTAPGRHSQQQAIRRQRRVEMVERVFAASHQPRDPEAGRGIVIPEYLGEGEELDLGVGREPTRLRRETAIDEHEAMPDGVERRR